MWLLHLQWVRMKREKPNNTLMYIRGTGKDYPRSALYTEDEYRYVMFDHI